MTEDVFVLPMSFAQQRLWFLDQLEPDTGAYNIPAALRLTGQLNVAVLKECCNEIVRRHESLRTTFATIDEQPMQVIVERQAINFSVIDLESLPQEEREAEVQRLVTLEGLQPFDLRHGPLLRVKLLRLSDESHVLLVTMHHIISDGWSMGVLVREMAALYDAFLQGKPSSLPELAIQYADFAEWQRDWLSGEVLEKQVSYWQAQLAGAPPLLSLPADRARPAVQTANGQTLEVELDAELSKKIKALSQQASTTLFMTLLAGFATLLSRLSGESDIVVGCPIANRNRHEIEYLIGFFVNTLILRSDLSSNPTFLELLAQVRQRALDAYAHQDVPFEKLVEELQPERNLSYTPLFQVMFVLQNAPMDKLQLSGLTIEPIKSNDVSAKFDLILSIEERGANLVGVWEYNSDLFEDETIQRVTGHFQTLLAAIVANPQQRVNELPLLTDAERHQLLVEWNQSDRATARDGPYVEWFEEQVARTPDAVAAIFEGESLSYRELNARANQWARVLIKSGVAADRIVALLAYRGLDFLTAVLAIFKAGGAYLPLDPFHPAQRIHQVLEQSQAPLVLVAGEFEALLRESPPLTPPNTRGGTSDSASPSGRVGAVLLIEELAEQGQTQKEENLPARSTPNDLAYVIYTSGSTGMPKGAMVEQKGMLNHLYAKISDLNLTESDTVGQNASQCFDISVWQFLAALLVGGRVYIFNEEAARDPVQLLQEVADHRVTILEVVPSLLYMMLEVAPTVRPDLAQLRWLVPTGEALPPSLCREWFKHYAHIPMINAYGPTECSDDVTHYAIHEAPADEVVNMPIGRPIANMKLYILDGNLQPVPIGVAGELYVGGIGVGRGYLNDPERTEKAFIADPFSSEANARLYKTGDEARYLADGNIEFLGRLDFQVKIRGFRIELGEIEAVLGGHANLGQVVVIVREPQPGDKRLVAYVVPSQEEAVSATQLRRYLIERLPDYMLPSAFVSLESLPLTPNGKINRRALQDAPLPEQAMLNEGTKRVAPRTEAETRMAAIWADVLGQDATQLGIHHNFFELGGHSLLATQIISRLRKTFQVELPLRTFFEEPTIAGLVEQIEKQQQIVIELQTSVDEMDAGQEREEIEL